MNQGLAALTQPASMPKGKSPETMNQIMALARRMSDAQLADVLAGRSMDVPQYVAMTEAMGRKKLRTAMQGQQAMAQAQQPTVKDRLAAETAQTAGLDQLPAPNMGAMNMAAGGIVAFSGEDEDQVVEDKEEGKSKNKEGRNLFERIRDSLYSPSEVYLADVMRGKKPTPLPGPQLSAANIEAMRQGKAPMVMTDEQKAELQRESTRGIRAPLANVPVAAAPAVGGAPAPSAAAPVSAAGPAAGGAPSFGGMPSYEDLMKRRTTDYLSKLEELPKKQREGLAQLKKEGLGDFLMNLSQGILSKSSLSAGIAAGLPGAIQAAAATRKQARGIENLANEYEFNIAKAREAAERGDMGMALQYQQVANQAQQIANQNKYQMGILGVQGERNKIMGESSMLPRVQLGLANADKQALAEAKLRFPVVTKSNRAAFDAFLKQRAYELKMENPLTKPYASLGGGDIGGGSNFNVVQSLPKGAKVLDLED